jgi:hypothetical protein
MRVRTLVLVFTLAVTAASARGQGPPNVGPNVDINKVRDDYLRKKRKEFDDLVACGRGILGALFAAGGAYAAMKGARAMRSNRRVVREDPQARKSDPGSGPLFTQPTSSTAVTDKQDAPTLTVTSPPKENRDEASLLTGRMVLSNQLSEGELIDCLGEPSETFKACPVVAIMCFITSAALIGLGTVGGLATIRWYLSGQPNSLPLAMVFFFGVPLSAMISGGVWLFVWAIRRFSFRLLVCPAGIIQVYRRNAVGAHWDQISAVDLEENTDRDGRTDRKCVVHRVDGFKFVFRSNYPKRVRKLMEIIVSHVRT